MYIHKLFYLCRDTDYNEQIKDTVYNNVLYAYITYIADENGKYDPRDKSKLRVSNGLVVLDPIDTNNFVAYKDVTDDVLLNWIKQKINEVELQNLNIQQFNS